MSWGLTGEDAVKQFGGRMIGCLLVGAFAILFLIAGGEQMAVPQMLNHGLDITGLILMVVSSVILYICLRFLMYYIMQIRRGTQTARATVTGYYRHEDSDGDVMIRYRFRTDDGQDLVFGNLPWKAFRNHELSEAVKHKGTRVSIDWYPVSEECRAIRLIAPWTANASAPDTDADADETRAESHDDADAVTSAAPDIPAVSTAPISSGTGSIAVEADRHTQAPLRTAWIVALVAIAAVVVAALLLSQHIDGMGMQLLVRKLIPGLAAFAATVIMLLHLAADRAIRRRAAAQTREAYGFGANDASAPASSGAGTGNDGTDDDAAGVSLRRDLAIILTLLAVGLGCVRNPATALIEGPRTETVTMSSSDGTKLGDYAYFMFHTSGRASDYINVAVPADQAQSARDEINRLNGGQKDRPMELTYWPGGLMKAYDHVSPAKSDPTVE